MLEQRISQLLCEAEEMKEKNRKMESLVESLKVLCKHKEWHACYVSNLEMHIRRLTENHLQRHSSKSGCGELREGTSVLLRISSLKKLMTAVENDSFLRRIVSRRHSFLSVGTGPGIDVSIASMMSDTRVSVGFDIQESLIRQGKWNLQCDIPWHIRKRVTILCADLCGLSTMDPFDIIYCNARG